MTKFVTLIALLALSMLVIVPASAVNEYRDMNPAKDIVDPLTYGYVQFYINAGGSAQDLTVYLQNVKQNLTFDSRWNPDRNDIEGQNGEWTKIQILPDGKSEKVLLTSGETFEACLRNGNGNQPECKRFIVGGADTTAVVFQGAAVTSLGEEEVVKVSDDVCVKKTVDVTGIVRGLVYHNKLHINADYEHLHYNALFGDPDVGTLKELRVVYRYYGWWVWKLDIKSAEYGTFCEDTKVPRGYNLKSVMEDKGIHIGYRSF